VKQESVVKDVMSVDYKRTAVFVLIFWTVVIGAGLTWTFFREQEGAQRAALEAGRALLKKDMIFRNWNAGHGGVYVPITDQTQPNPDLKGFAERDIETPSGKHLTLINPDYMTRQFFELGLESEGISGHIISLNPIRAENRVDAWETRALELFERDSAEVFSIETINGVQHLRLIQPLLNDEGCLQCHEKQGYREGDIRGGLSVTLPLTPYLLIAREHTLGMATGLGFLWVLGVVILAYAVMQLRLRKKERLYAIHELQASQEKYETLFLKMLDGFAVHELIYDSEGTPIDYRFLSINPAFERLTGLKAQDIEGKTVLEVIPNTEQYWIDTYGQVVISGEPAFMENYAEGLGKYFEVTAFKSAPNQFVTIFADVTEQKQVELERFNLEKQLMQSQRLETVGTMVGGISHELNNVLQSLFLYGGLIQDELSQESELHKNMQLLLDDGERAKNLVKQILTFSRKSELAYEPQQIHEIIRSALKFKRASLAPKIKIEQDIDPNCPRVLCDRTQIHQMVINLCNNSEYAIGENDGTISISLQETEAQLHKDLPVSRVLELKVSDNGQGMESDILERIFDPFFTTKSLGQGTGLGLSVVYGIVRMMNGKISASSKVGKGTSFKVLVPTVTDSKMERTAATSEENLT